MTASDRAHVRRLLADTDPLAPGQYAGAADDADGRRTLAGILADPPRRRPILRRRVSSRRRRWLVVTGSAVAVVSAAGAAGAAGFAPTSVIEGLLRGEEPYTTWGKLDTSKAQLVIEARGPDGALAQWWFAPGEKGGGCVYLRSVTAHGKSDGSTECSGPPGILPPRDEKLRISYAPLADDWMGVVGRAAPPAVRIRVTFGDGTRELVPVRADGYFMRVFDRRRPAGTETVDTAALDAEGRVLASQRTEGS
ncbi:hypothetical protein [Actinomadura fibrosa]|uniref:Uncharacterized protein n=1 Tax=Actinomadura fibrosa TaxID=111802 RepID=A0ABW2XS39_9ACTN|nr:hypothetical protein [Actinomadura fibrosa]